MIINQQYNLTELYSLLRRRFGHQGWWPGESKLEIVVGAILTQQTNWNNVEKALSRMKESDLLKLENIAAADPEIEKTIIPTGFYRQKSKRLVRMAQWILENHGNLDNFLGQPFETLREQLLFMEGIGPETADSIILYAAGIPVFVVDSYTFRILTRMGVYKPVSNRYVSRDYQLIQQLFHENLTRDLHLYRDYHAQFVRLGKEYCRTDPKCDGCPIQVKCKRVLRDR